MSYQNPDYELKLSEAKARKILSHLKLKSAGRSRKEKAASEGLVSKRKSEIDKKVAEVEAKKSEEIAKKQRTKTKVHPKPEPPKSLVIDDTMANIKAPAPYQEYSGRGRGRGRGGNRASPRKLTTEEIEENRRKIRESDQQVRGKIGVAKEGLPLGFYSPGEQKVMDQRNKEARIRAKRASGKSEFSDSDFSD